MYDDLNQRIPRAECKEIYEIVQSETLQIDPKVNIEIMGSYRRGSDNSGDVDFLITRDDSDGLNHSGVIQRLIERLMKMGIITHEVRQMDLSDTRGRLGRCCLATADRVVERTSRLACTGNEVDGRMSTEQSITSSSNRSVPLPSALLDVISVALMIKISCVYLMNSGVQLYCISQATTLYVPLFIQTLLTKLMDLV